jgi:acetyl esterase/lipase
MSAIRTSLYLAAFAMLCASGGPARAQTAPTLPNQTYATVEGRALQLDVYLPQNPPRPPPLVVWVHGGGWTSGARAPLPGYVAPLLGEGLAVASVSYRLTSQAGQWGSAPVHFPAQIHDVKAALRWLRARADTLGYDGSRIGLWGPSAGGHLVALAGTSGDDPQLALGDHPGVSTAVAAVVNYYGPSDVLRMMLDVTTPPGTAIDHDAPSSPESRLLGFSGPGEGVGVLRANLDNPNPPFPELAERARLSNPISFVDGDEPPFFSVHGTADRSVPFGQSTRLRQALAAAGRPAEVLDVIDGGHGGFADAVHAQARAFLRRQLLEPVFSNGFED